MNVTALRGEADADLVELEGGLYGEGACLRLDGVHVRRVEAGGEEGRGRVGRGGRWGGVRNGPLALPVHTDTHVSSVPLPESFVYLRHLALRALEECKLDSCVSFAKEVESRVQLGAR
jgi:hypothetical protein